MAEKLDPNEIVTLEELAISSMWEMAALVEVLEKKGVLKKQDILDAIRELRKKNPQAKRPTSVEPESSHSTVPSTAQAENALIERILELILAAGLSAPERAPRMSPPNLQLLSEFECFEIWNFVGK